MEIKLLKEFSISLRMGQIEAGPPLSTIIGNVGGINSVKFFKELNEYTKVLPNYFMLEVKIKIFMDKSYIFTVVEPSTALLLRLISKKIEVKLKSSGGWKVKVVNAVKISDIYLVSLFKFGNCNDNSLKIIYGCLNSLELYVIS